MNTFAFSLPVLLFSGFLAFSGPIPQSTQRSAPTKLAHFEMGAYMAREGARLRINVDKELGGQVEVQLRDTKGTVYFTRVMNPADTFLRLNVDVSGLNDGDYVLKVSNGLEMIVRDIKITTKAPTNITRSLTIL